MRTIVVIVISAFIFFGCKKSETQNNNNKKASSYASLTIDGHTYTDSVRNEDSDSATGGGVYISFAKVNDYQTSQKKTRCSILIGTKNFSIFPFYTQKDDTTTNTGDYYSKLTYSGTTPKIDIVLTDKANGNKVYICIDTSSIVHILANNEHEVSGTFIINMAASISPNIVVQATGTFLLRK